MSVYLGDGVGDWLRGHDRKFGNDGKVLQPDGSGGCATEFVKTHQIILLKLVHFFDMQINKIWFNEEKKSELSS